MKCEICGRGPADGVTVYRANEKGVRGVWRCERHPCAESFARQHDPAIEAIDNALSVDVAQRKEQYPGTVQKVV